MPVLTPNSMQFGQPNTIPEEAAEIKNVDHRKRAKYLRRCKDVIWLRRRGGSRGYRAYLLIRSDFSDIVFGYVIVYIYNV